MKKLVLGVAALLLASCGTASHVMVGAKRAPISPEQVKVYSTPPANYEQVAILEASSAGSGAFTAQQKTDKVMSKLKEEAASLGANGILLQGVGSQMGAAVINTTTTGSTGFGTVAPIMHKTGSAIAIYVP